MKKLKNIFISSFLISAAATISYCVIKNKKKTNNNINECRVYHLLGKKAKTKKIDEAV